jgi:hypothetical protein
MVVVTGLIKSGLQSNIFMLPVGYRIGEDSIFGGACGDPASILRIDVHTNGYVTQVAGPNNFVSLAGISFYAEG